LVAFGCYVAFGLLFALVTHAFGYTRGLFTFGWLVLRLVWFTVAFTVAGSLLRLRYFARCWFLRLVVFTHTTFGYLFVYVLVTVTFIVGYVGWLRLRLVGYTLFVCTFGCYPFTFGFVGYVGWLLLRSFTFTFTFGLHVLHTVGWLLIPHVLHTFGYTVTRSYIYTHTRLVWLPLVGLRSGWFVYVAVVTIYLVCVATFLHVLVWLVLVWLLLLFAGDRQRASNS